MEIFTRVASSNNATPKIICPQMEIRLQVEVRVESLNTIGSLLIKLLLLLFTKFYSMKSKFIF